MAFVQNCCFFQQDDQEKLDTEKAEVPEKAAEQEEMQFPPEPEKVEPSDTGMRQEVHVAGEREEEQELAGDKPAEQQEMGVLLQTLVIYRDTVRNEFVFVV